MSFNEYWEAERKRQAVADALHALRPDDPAAQQRLYAALRVATLLLPVDELPPGMQSGEVLGSATVSLRVTLVAGPEKGKRYLPAFTSEATLRRSVPPEHPYLLVGFDALAGMTLQARAGGLIVDRGASASAVVTLPIVIALARGGKGVQATVGPIPRALSVAEVEVVAVWLRAEAAIQQAWLFGLGQPGQPPVLTVALALDRAANAEQLATMATQLQRIVGPSGVVALTPALLTVLARQAGTLRWQRSEGVGDPPPA